MKQHTMCFAAVILFFVTLLHPGDVFAWGAGVHLTLGARLLANPQALPEALKALLAAWPFDFLYGCVAADITLGKKFTHYLEHCHNWRIGLKILDNAKSPQHKACAWGYIAHLAADTVAHNYFVPFKMTRTFNTVMLKHTYWEMRAENQVTEEIWQLARDLGKRDYRSHDAMLSSVLSDTILSFRTNKRLFNSILLVSRLQQWQKLLNGVTIRSKWEFTAEDQQEYVDLAFTAIEGILGDERSPFWQADPTGDRALTAARLIRRNLNMLWLDGKLRPEDADMILGDLKQRFRAGITDPDSLLDLLIQV
ncbi:zinc dependent phospholipase C family protein [Geopsychrobacter electrodiphilus]|uniref:zinc dependent phospholipase C family protein n=1 Tax=Geopsychrobacter electrodiphilus TaxID=225196 RepID=UPI000362EA01|nr:zinc dependent phospholipase C family protein [Geopsychrobacter electrodiphilus]